MKNLVLTTILFSTILIAHKSEAANCYHEATFEGDATFIITGNCDFINGFKEAYDISQEEALIFLQKSKRRAKCKIWDTGANGSKFTAKGKPKEVVKAWQEWMQLAGGS